VEGPEVRIEWEVRIAAYSLASRLPLLLGSLPLVIIPLREDFSVEG
jgi:hypothetical protein